MPLSRSLALSMLLTAGAKFFGCEDGKLACHGPHEWCREQCSTLEHCQRLERRCDELKERHANYRQREKSRKTSQHRFWKKSRPVPDEEAEAGQVVTVPEVRPEPRPRDPPGFADDAYVELGSDPMAGGFLRKNENGRWDVWPRMGGKSFE
eukprot:CAMPEP_0179226398 /NCGR_PEP_ID=MMETSP0797-20121207/8794_1 /TAXON_ID=47934 /ORGANISM="Dinophysis acuminata, Strain DAEP01" /LENGTH=150 /DNA_ID=CAMNT_0020933427 /DNA_START=47 /DNA_END=496 /DNA_ORIENTATION=-